MRHSKCGRILVVDPGCVSPEAEVYNILNRMFAELADASQGTISCLHFVLPKIGNMRLRDVAAQFDVAGIISLGSVANITENLAWVNKLSEDLAALVFECGIPFYGSCFSHQLLGSMVGNKVDYLKNRADVPLRKHRGARMSKIVHPKLGVLFAKLNDADYLSGNAADLSFIEACENVRDWGRNEWKYVADKSSYHTQRENQFLEFLRQRVPRSFVARVAHEQEVWNNINPDFAIAASSDACLVDGLVHFELPIFSLQSHPEWFHKRGDGWRLIKNFMYFIMLRKAWLAANY